MPATYVDKYDHVTGARMAVEKYSWDRISTAAGPHDHAFSKGTAETRTTVVRKDGHGETVISGLTGLVVLKSTGSEFHGFPDVDYTSLVETDDRILATAVTARWLYTTTDLDWDKTFASVRSVMLDEFATTHGLSLQQTLFAMGKGALEAVPEIAEIRLSLPNKHHFLVDMTKWDLDNPNQVFYAADRPYGLIEAAIVRNDAPAALGSGKASPRSSDGLKVESAQWGSVAGVTNLLLMGFFGRLRMTAVGCERWECCLSSGLSLR